MVKIEVTKVILTRSEDWALVKYRSVDGAGTCGGKFGCQASAIVPGQWYRGKLTLKRTRAGPKKCSFVGLPVSRTAHALKTSFQRNGISYTDRASIFSAIKPLDTLLSALKNKKHQQLMNVAHIGRKKLSKLYVAYDAIANDVSVSLQLSKTFPLLHSYMNANQTAAAMKWMHDSSERFVQFLVADPWRLLYDTEYDSFSMPQQRRSEFLTSTTHKSRTKMVELACQDLKILPDGRAKRCNAIHFIRQYMKRTGNYWMPLYMLTAACGEIQTSWPCNVHDGHVALAKYAGIEKFLTTTFASIVTNYSQSHWTPPPDDAQLDSTQREAVERACQEPLFILHGGAGVGKTLVCKHIVQSLSEDVICAAPTGKAAQRLSVMTGCAASTVHRLVYSSDNLTGTLLLDEQSMQEPEILALLLQKNTFNQIIFVGDCGQLTSVGPGQFFRDICNSDMAQIELVHIYRSGPGSYIASNGQKVRDGITTLDTSPGSFEICPYTNDDDIVNNAKVIYTKTGVMPMILCNTNAEIAPLNQKLRQICNPIGAKPYSTAVCMEYYGTEWRYQDWRFGVGDSVINITNKYESDKDGKTYLQVANGEIGTVVRAKGVEVTVHFETNVVFDIAQDNSLRPAYALTVNKAQGSEYPIVIVKAACTWGDKRERFYTAITRAQDMCIVYEVGNSIQECIRAKKSIRKTYLF
mgnify:CR=1 FL=1|jgi:hypothetical protein|tara:strand:+ start:10127 stop:12205 length:2079 start_codon:yes stop_codon:yes gene_type:complete